MTPIRTLTLSLSLELSTLFCLRVSTSILILFFSSSLKKPSTFRLVPLSRAPPRTYDSCLSELLSVSFSVSIGPVTHSRLGCLRMRARGEKMQRLLIQSGSISGSESMSGLLNGVP